MTIRLSDPEGGTTRADTLMVRVPRPRAYTLLPRAAQEALIEAASTNPTAPPGESKDRRRALDMTIRQVKQKFPQFFNQDVKE